MINEHCFAIPVYKDSPFLEQCITSILQQNTKSDIIICTSTPTFQNKQLADKYNLPFIVNTTGDIGIASDWNFALNSAKTKFVTITHQDDIYEPDFSQSVIQSMDNKTLMSFTNYADIHGESLKVWTVNKIIKTILLFPFLIKKRISFKFFKKSILSIGNSICCPSVTINKELLPDFRFSETYSCILDWYAWYEIAQKNGSFVFINKRLVKHRIHQDSETSNQIKIGKRRDEEETMLIQIWGKLLGKAIAKVYQLGQLENNV